MDVEVTANYSEGILRTAVRRFWWRVFRWDVLVATLMLALGGVMAWSTGEFAGIPRIITIVVGVSQLFFYLFYFLHLRRSLSVFRMMKVPSAKFRFSDDGISVESDLGKSQLKWAVIRRVWKFPEVWLLFYFNGSWSNLPTEALNPELASFIEKKVLEHGGSIR